MTSHTHGFRIFMGFSSPTGHRAEGLLHLEFLSSTFLHNLKPCDWSDCPKARLPLVETGSNVSEEDQVLGSRGEMLFTVQVYTNWFCQIKLVWAGIKTIY